MKPEPITIMIFVMRASAAAGAFIAAKIVPSPLDLLCSFGAHVMAIMTALVVFGHAEKVIGEYLLTLPGRLLSHDHRGMDEHMVTDDLLSRSKP
jgi:hypothetical protein